LSRHLLDELNSATSFRQKLRVTFLLVVFGGLVAPLLWLGTQLVQGEYVQPMTRLVVDTIAVYYVTLLVFIWWRPPFLQKLYASQERELAVHGFLLAAGCLVFLLIGAAHGLMQFFGHA